MADEPVIEPDNSTVHDWFGQSVARDAEKADELVADRSAIGRARLLRHQRHDHDGRPGSNAGGIGALSSGGGCVDTGGVRGGGRG